MVSLLDSRVEVFEDFGQLQLDRLDDWIDHVERVLEASVVFGVLEDNLHQFQVLRLLHLVLLRLRERQESHSVVHILLNLLHHAKRVI